MIPLRITLDITLLPHDSMSWEEVFTMKVSAVDSSTIHDAGSISSQPCPKCGGIYLTRIHRRFTDRLLSLFVKVYRYRCDSPLCEWKGNIRVYRHSK